MAVVIDAFKNNTKSKNNLLKLELSGQKKQQCHKDIFQTEITVEI